MGVGGSVTALWWRGRGTRQIRMISNSNPKIEPAIRLMV